MTTVNSHKVEDRAVLLISVARAGTTPLFSITLTGAVTTEMGQRRSTIDPDEVLGLVTEWLRSVSNDLRGSSPEG
jgi:hypothetical protein